MIKFENTDVIGWEATVRGMRNPLNSWDKSDSKYLRTEDGHIISNRYEIGTNDLTLMKKLNKAGTDHRKFMRMIAVYVDITAPLYWWKEFDTYKVGTVANSTSTMHKITEKEFTLEDFSCEHLLDNGTTVITELITSSICAPTLDGKAQWSPINYLLATMCCLNQYREEYLEINRLLKTKELTEEERKDLIKQRKCYWWQIIQLLPSSYNQKRTVQMNYEVLANIYKSRQNHKLDEWSVDFMNFIKSLPYSELITGESDN